MGSGLSLSYQVMGSGHSLSYIDLQSNHDKAFTQLMTGLAGFVASTADASG